MGTWRYTYARDPGHYMTFVQGHSDFNNFKPLLPRSHWTDWSQTIYWALWDNVTQIYRTGMAAMLIYGKNLYNPTSVPNGRFHWTLDTQVLQVGSNDDPRLNFDLCIQMSNFNSLCFCMVDFSETIEFYDIKVLIDNGYMKMHVNQREKTCFDFC